jgi:hypothetical protein
MPNPKTACLEFYIFDQLKLFRISDFEFFSFAPLRPFDGLPGAEPKRSGMLCPKLLYFLCRSGGMKPWRKVFSEIVRGSRNCNR